MSVSIGSINVGAGGVGLDLGADEIRVCGDAEVVTWVERVKELEPRLRIEIGSASAGRVVIVGAAPWGSKAEVIYDRDTTPERAALLLWAGQFADQIASAASPRVLREWLLEGATVGVERVRGAIICGVEVVALDAVGGAFMIGASTITYASASGEANTKPRGARDGLWGCEGVLREAYADLRLQGEAPRCLAPVTAP